MEFNNNGSNSSQYGVEKLVGTNYMYWQLCMKAYLQGQDLWDLVYGVDTKRKILRKMLKYAKNGRSSVEKLCLHFEHRSVRIILIMFIMRIRQRKYGYFRNTIQEEEYS